MSLPITRANAGKQNKYPVWVILFLTLSLTALQVVLGLAWWYLLNDGYEAFTGLTLAVPTGLIIACVLGIQPILWLSVPLAQFILSSWSDLSLAINLSLTCGVSLEVIACYGVLQLLHLNPTLIRLRDLCLLLGTVLIVVQPFSAFYQSMIVFALDSHKTESFNAIWLTLWSVGSIEKLIVIPLILSLLHNPISPDGRLIEFLVCAGLLLVNGFYSASLPTFDVQPSFLIIFPLLSFIALRQSLTLTALSLLLLCSSVVTATWLYNPMMLSLPQNTTLNWLLLGAVTSTLLVCVHHRNNRHRQQLYMQTASQYEKLFNNAPVLINGFDNKGRCLVWNTECEVVFQWSKEEIMQHPNPLELLYPDPQYRAKVLEHIHGDHTNTLSTEWHPITRHGNVLTILWGNVRINTNQTIGIGVNLSDRVRSENEMRLIKERYDNLVRRIPAGVFTLRQTPQGHLHYEYVSPKLCEIYALTASEIYQNPNSLSNKWYPEDRLEIIRKVTESRDWLQPIQMDVRLLLHDEERWIRINANPIRLSNGDTLYDGIQTDITQIKQAEFELSIAASVFQRSYDSIFILSTDHYIVDANPSAIRLSGYDRSQLLGAHITQLLLDGVTDVMRQQEAWHHVETQGVWQGEVQLLAANQETYPLQFSIVPIQNSKGVTLRYIAVGTDVSIFKAREAQLVKLAHFDPLTQLPNRHLLDDRIRQAISTSNRNGNLLAVCYIDLDGFKKINDKYGHDVGDQVLQSVSARLLKELRQTDTIARVGGDELVLLLNELNGPNECQALLARILQVIAMPNTDTDKPSLCISASIGVSFYPLHSRSPSLLLQFADRAMYIAKRAGKNSCHFYHLDP